METGHKLGPYEIREQIGKGGMGEVYLAQDTRLGRTVAIKVLPAEFAGDPERLARFEQEARAAAALNHPHIAAVYDVGHEDGIHFMVQEHLEGRTLRAAISEGRLPLKKGLKLALEIVEGLGAAHAEGIVHRDLKPENIFVSPDGHAKILDFGLAKLTEIAVPSGDGSASMSPTVLGTVAGQMMGTAGYMAPEQVEGVDIDHRADIFAFGCVLYELGAGQQAFRGKNLVDTLHRVSNVDPDGLVTIDGSLPDQLQRILDKSLDKDPAARYQTSGDLAVDLRALIASVESGDAVPVALAGARISGGLTPAAVAGIAIATLALGVVATMLLTRPEAVVGRLTHLEYGLVDDDGGFTGPGRRPLSISPDGRWVAFADDGLVRLRGLADPTLLAVRGTDNPRTPIFSPDSEWIAFTVGDELLKVPLEGGAPILLAEIENQIGMSWGTDDFILLSTDEGVQRVPGNGGEAETLIAAQDGETIQGPSMLPGGEWVLFSVRERDSSSWSDAGVVAQSLATGDRRLLVPGGVEPRYVESGHLTFARDGNLLAVPLDLESMEVTGGAVALVEGFPMASNGGAYYDVSVAGDLVYYNGGAGGGRALRPAWYDLDGTLETLPFEGADINNVALAPDGNRIALQRTSDGGEWQLWIYEIDRRSAQRLTPDDLVATNPEWSPDGEWVYFTDISSNGVSRIRADFTGVIETVAEDLAANVHDVSPDGRELAVMRQGNSWDIGTVDIETGQFDELVATPALEAIPQYSPDGRFIAYGSNESGQFETYVRDLESGRRYVASTEGGGSANWSPDGRILYFTVQGRLTSVTVETGPSVRLGAPTELFDLTVRAGFPRAGMDVAPDGQRIMIITSQGTSAQADDGESAPGRIHVLLNWAQVLRERVTSR